MVQHSVSVAEAMAALGLEGRDCDDCYQLEAAGCVLETCSDPTAEGRHEVSAEYATEALREDPALVRVYLPLPPGHRRVSL